jgi:hypothetical protein
MDIMSAKYDPAGKTPISLEEAMNLLEIENAPLSAEALARHERFEREGLSVEQRIEAIKAEIGSPAVAAE